MTRIQAIITRGHKILMARHRLGGQGWWCLPGGALETGETPEEAVVRELREECCVDGCVIRKTAAIHEKDGGQTISFLVDIGGQEPRLGSDPEFEPDDQALIDIQWLSLDEIPERDRAFLWASGLLAVRHFANEVEAWSDEISYPGK